MADESGGLGFLNKVFWEFNFGANGSESFGN